MLSKVAQRVRRRSGVKRVERVEEVVELTSPRETVDCAPDLHRWCDLDTPFPLVTFGGYLRYYRGVKSDESTGSEPPLYSPTLSKISFSFPPPSSTGYEPPLPTTVSLFPGKEPIAQKSTASKPSVAPRTAISPRTRHLSLAPVSVPSTNAPSESSSPRSLRRKRATYLRAPSIERDFTDPFGRLFTPPLSITTATADATTTTDNKHVHSNNADTIEENAKDALTAAVSATPIQRSSSTSTDSSGNTSSDHNSTSTSSDSEHLFDDLGLEQSHPFSRRLRLGGSNSGTGEDDDEEPMSPATSIGATEEGGVEADLPLQVEEDKVGQGEEKAEEEEDVAKENAEGDMQAAHKLDKDAESEDAKEVQLDSESTVVDEVPTPVNPLEDKPERIALPTTSLPPPPVPPRRCPRPDSRSSYMTARSEFSDPVPST